MIQFLNSFEVPAGQEEEFLRLWQQVNDHIVTRPGYLGHRLHRSLADTARYRFVNYVSWENAECWRNAHDENFRAMVAGPEWRPFTSAPALYEVVHAAGTLR